MKIPAMNQILMRILPFALLSAGLALTGCPRHPEDGSHDHAGESPGTHANEQAANSGHDENEMAGEHHEDEAAEEHEAEDGHAEHKHAEQGDEGEILRLTPEQRARFGIVVRPAGPGSLRHELNLPGEVVFNEDRVVHMAPRVAGIAREVHKTVGDRVVAGEVLAVIESRELADAKAAYLAARARAGLAEKNFNREKSLREKQISSEKDFLESESALEEARIELRSAEQKLHALGLPERVVTELIEKHDDETITLYEILSPIDGVVTEKHISRGESLAADADMMTVVDTGSVWVNLTVYTKNLAAVQNGAEVEVRVEHSGAQGRGQVAMVTPFVEESTRSATARVVLDNRDGRWMPGTFVTGFISCSAENLPVVVSKGAVQDIEGREVVFVAHEDGFEMTPVTIGRSDRTSVEITSGLEPGMDYVAEGAFQLKATVITSNLGSHAGHGH